MEKSTQLVPAQGVYAGLVELGDAYEQVAKSQEKLPAVFSIGHTQTFGEGHPLLIEAHLLVENANRFSGNWLAMDFVQYMRPQRKFAAETDLVAQIASDCQKARTMLGSV